jgi:hypothetical protein
VVRWHPCPRSQEEYRNTKYGFCVSLPASWHGYSIVADHWEGATTSGPQGYQVVARGPLILIRHPLWTKENTRQDVPIMVFTHKQWDSMQKDEFHIGAAPVGPNELGRNQKYVFAVPARYDFTELTGVEEVRQIINGKSLHAPCKHKVLVK